MISESERKYDEALFDAARDDITAFSEYIEPEWFPARHHLYMLERLSSVLKGETSRLIITMPVGHGKSVYSSIVTPAFALGHNPHERIIAAGHTQNFVESAISKKIRGVINSERYKRLFPETVISNDSRASDYFTFLPRRGTQPGFVLAKGAGGGIAGFRSTLTVADDLYPTQQDANSKTFRDKVYTWWYSDLSTRLLPGGRQILVCTRWHGDDLLYHLMEDSKSGKGDHYEIVELPAICENPENDPLGRGYGEALWPEFHTLERLLEIKKSVPAITWNALYQCNPITDGGGIVDASWFTYWNHLPPENLIRRRFVSFDLANTATERSDFSVGTAWIQTVTNQFFLTDIVRVRVEYTELLKVIEDFALRNKAQTILVEDAGVGKTIGQTMQGKFSAPLVNIGTKNRDKEFRLDSITPMIQTGAVLFPARHELLADVERELVEFPMSKHDDIPDSISQALNWARGMTIKRGATKLRGTH